MAADMRRDADSLFNAGYCHATGSGTPRDLNRRVSLPFMSRGKRGTACAKISYPWLREHISICSSRLGGTT